MAKFKKISAIIIFGLLIICYVTSAFPNTDLVNKICNGHKYDEDDAIGSSIIYVQSDVTVQTSGHGYNYYSKSPWDTFVAYGHGVCNGVLSADDCNACMRAAYNTIVDGCPLNTGAQVQLVDCRIRHETYSFTE